MERAESSSKGARGPVGTVVSLHRYPVKSMLGEEIDASRVSERGLVGDRAYALVDRVTGRVASAKNPRKWGKLFDFRASVLGSLNRGEGTPQVQILLPDGTVTSSEQRDVDDRLSAALGTQVQLVSAPLSKPRYEEYWPDIEGLAHRDRVTEEAMPPQTFFDWGVLHVLTTATLDHLRELYPEGRFEVRRFRPNIVIEPFPTVTGFVEDSWVGRSLRVGKEVRLRVTKPCGRCVMATLPQEDLPRDLGILRTVARHNHGNVGAYASVEHGGTLERGDSIWIE